MIKRFLWPLLAALLLVMLDSPNAFSVSPHGKYMSSTELCKVCHVNHDAPSPAAQRSERIVRLNGLDYRFRKTMLLRNEDEKALCYTCHNGTASSSNVAREFGETIDSSAPVSKHPVPQGTVFCSDCHSPHASAENWDGNPEPNEVVRLLRSIYGTFLGFVVSAANGWLDSPEPANLTMGIPEQRKLSKPYEQCGSCHGAGSTLPGGDLLGFFDNGGAKHDSTDSVSPDSKAEIACMSCHQWHASSLPGLLATTIAGGTVNDNDNSVCYACHIEPKIASFDATVTGDIHGAADSTKTAGSPGLIDPYAYRTDQIKCTVCHNPHGTGNVFWTPTEINGIGAISVDGTTASDRSQWEGYCASCHTYSHESTATYDTCVACHFHGASTDASATTRF